VYELGPVDESKLFAPAKKFATGYWEEIQPRLRESFRYFASLARRFEAHGYTRADQRDQVFAYLVSFSDVAWRKTINPEMRRVGSYLKTLIVTGHWEHYIDPERAELAAKGLQWLANQQEPTHDRQSRPQQAPQHATLP
jgi:hypothetical protein